MNMQLSLQPSWYALRVKPQHEKVVALGLRERALEEFLPLYRTRRTWSDRVKELDLPMFDGYVFCRFPFENRVKVLQTPGVIRIVGFGSQPCPVSDLEVDGIRRIVASGLPVMPWPFLEVGKSIRVERGPLRGVEGVLLRIKDHWRVIANVNILQRSVAVEVDRDLISVVESSMNSARKAG